ncbi:MAG: RNA polymerase factor sigma-54 [Rubricella sp.]
MAIGPRIELRQRQSLAITPQLRQAISLLELGATELEDTLTREAEANPLLEFRPATGLAADRPDDAQIAERPSLQAHLQRQIAVSHGTDRGRALATLLVGELDERGYLAAPLFELADRHDARVGEIEDALGLLQSCDPPGIGARTLAECLELQLLESGAVSPVMRTVLGNLDLVAAARLDDLARRAGVPIAAIEDALERIRALDPAPARAFTIATAPAHRPEIVVTRKPDGTLRVELAPDALPRLLIDETYAAELSAAGSETRRFASIHRANATALQRALDTRARLLFAVAREIVSRQAAFFERGPEALVPLRMGEIARAVDAHESTISRIVRAKMLQGPNGAFLLRSFFGVSASATGAEIAPRALKLRIRRIIEEENPQTPLPDREIAARLEADGVDVARRTVAKYREEMGIGSSAQRKRAARLRSWTRR